jgi:hypothetical protein
MAPNLDESLRDDVETFFGYFAAQCQFLSDLPEMLGAQQLVERYGYSPVPNVVLLQACASIDALGRVAAAGKRVSSQRRFVDALAEHSGISTWSLVSLSEFWWAVRHPNAVDEGRLKQQLEQLAARRQWANPPQQARDLLVPQRVADLSHIVPATSLDHTLGETMSALAGAGIDCDDASRRVLAHFTHAAVFYRDYRCALAHEARRKAKGWHFSQQQVPHYAAYDHDDEVAVCLVIPNSYVLNSLAELGARLKRSCLRQGVNPFSFYPDPFD